MTAAPAHSDLRNWDQARVDGSAVEPSLETVRRTMHGSTAWTMPGAEDHPVPLYQPQDSASHTRRATFYAGESEDARLTGGTRSLMRRLSGLNLATASSLGKDDHPLAA